MDNSKKELRAIIRDKKSLLMMLIGPLMIPTMIILMSSVYDTLMTETEEENTVIGINYDLNEVEKSITKELKIDTKKETDKKLKKDYNNGKFRAYIIKVENKYTIYSNPNEDEGMKATALISTYLDQYNTALGNEYLVKNGIDLDKVYKNIEIDTVEIKGESSMVNYVLYMGFVFAMMSISLTAIYGVTDSTAGEKERGTLETLLTFPMESDELVKGKFYAITISRIITSIISTLLLVGSIEISKGIFDIYKDITINLNFGTILLILVVMFNISFFISGLCIPIVSHTMLLDDAISNNVNITYLLISLISTIIYSLIVVKIITKMYKSENVLFGN